MDIEQEVRRVEEEILSLNRTKYELTLKNKLKKLEERRDCIQADIHALEQELAGLPEGVYPHEKGFERGKIGENIEKIINILLEDSDTCKNRDIVAYARKHGIYIGSGKSPSRALSARIRALIKRESNPVDFMMVSPGTIGKKK